MPQDAQDFCVGYSYLEIRHVEICLACGPSPVREKDMEAYDPGPGPGELAGVG